jgi:hypothetical protein
MVLQEELEHSYLCKLTDWCWNSFKLISFFQRRSPKVSAVGRLHYDCYHYTSKLLELEIIINVRLLTLHIMTSTSSCSVYLEHLRRRPRDY